MSTWDRFFVALGGQHGFQNPPKMRSKRPQHRWQIDVQVDYFFVCLQDRFFQFFWPNMAPNEFPRGTPRVAHEGVFGGHFGPLGALGAPDPPRCVFYWFLIDFWAISDRFFMDFVAFWEHFRQVLGAKILQLGAKMTHRLPYMDFLYNNCFPRLCAKCCACKLAKVHTALLKSVNKIASSKPANYVYNLVDIIKGLY